MGVVGHLFKIVVLLLVVTAVTTILLTPTPTDDVPGVMHRNHGPVFASLTRSLVLVASVAKTFRFSRAVSGDLLLPSNLLELQCQHLC